MFSHNSSQAIFEMGNVEFIELQTSRIQCPPRLHDVFKGTILCARGKHITPDQEMIRRVEGTFEILKAPCFRTSAVTARGCKLGPNLWQEHHHKAKDALRGTKKVGRKFTPIWSRWPLTSHKDTHNSTHRHAHWHSHTQPETHTLYRYELPPEFPLTLPWSVIVHHLSGLDTCALSFSTLKITGGCRCVVIVMLVCGCFQEFTFFVLAR